MRFDSASEVQLGGKFQQGQKGSSLEDVDLEQGNGAREEGEAGLVIFIQNNKIFIHYIPTIGWTRCTDLMSGQGKHIPHISDWAQPY